MVKIKRFGALQMRSPGRIFLQTEHHLSGKPLLCCNIFSPNYLYENENMNILFQPDFLFLAVYQALARVHHSNWLFMFIKFTLETIKDYFKGKNKIVLSKEIFIVREWKFCTNAFHKKA